MRIFAVLAVCILAVGQAVANDVPAKDAAAAPAASAHGAPTAAPAPPSIVPSIKPVKPSAAAITGALAAKDKRTLKPVAPSAVTTAREEMSESELALKVAERVAAMRKMQVARAAAAKRVKKEKEKVHSDVPAPIVYRHSEHWSYEGDTGPDVWGKINSKWVTCGIGNRQSPIDIRDGIKVELEPIGFDYKPSSFSVTDNGHTVQVTLGGGNYITIMNRMYELVQFHFHRPSEERINGRGFEMVVHLVHKDSQGKLAVIAVLIERGKAQHLIQTIWNNLPLEKGDSSAPNIVLDMNDILPTRRDYYTFMGSLTTPPCTEGVLWMVMKEPVQASAEQMALFSRLYPLNARPTQPNSGRMIKESN